MKLSDAQVEALRKAAADRNGLVADRDLSEEIILDLYMTPDEPLLRYAGALVLGPETPKKPIYFYEITPAGRAALKEVENKEDDMSGIELIAAERQRQIEQEGWTPEHDDHHDDDSLARAAAYYAWPGQPFRQGNLNEPEYGMKGVLFILWPESWDHGYARKHSKDRKRQLVVAGALIAAEIDRLERAEAVGNCQEAQS